MRLKREPGSAVLTADGDFGVVLWPMPEEVESEAETPVATKGSVYVKPAVPVKAGDLAYYRPDMALTNEQAGNRSVPNGVWRTSCDDGGLAILTFGAN